MNRRYAILALLLVGTALSSAKYLTQSPAPRAAEPPMPPRRDVLPKGLALEEVPVLADWVLAPLSATEPLSDARVRNPFEMDAPVQPVGAIPVLEPLPLAAPEQPDPEPEEDIGLTGFIWRTREDGAQEAVAVLRWAGEILLLTEGGSAGPYVVDRIVAGEAVELLSTSTGERKSLRIE